MKVEIELNVDDECEIVRRSLEEALELVGKYSYPEDQRLKEALEVVLEYYSVPK